MHLAVEKNFTFPLKNLQTKLSSVFVITKALSFFSSHFSFFFLLKSSLYPLPCWICRLKFLTFRRGSKKEDQSNNKRIALFFSLSITPRWVVSEEVRNRANDPRGTTTRTLRKSGRPSLVQAIRLNSVQVHTRL